jgi:hypothetical protein
MKQTGPSGLRKVPLTFEKGTAATVAALALALAPAARGHVTAVPPFVAAGSHATLRLDVPNERDVAMTGLAVVVPDGMTIHDARRLGRWRAAVHGHAVRWSGGSVAPRASASFALDVGAPRRPGRTTLTARQAYADGREVAWDVELQVTPGTGGGEHPWAAAIVALLGIVGVVAASLLVLRRTRRRTLQEG